ncbi:Thymidylate kinase domain containing protein [Russula decolorans]|jgi:dTMP kinase
MARGAFIVIEGLDRSGKTTQTEHLTKHLTTSGISIERRKFPDRTTGTGRLIDAYLHGTSDLDDRAIHLLFSANRWEAVASLEAKLATGTTVLCDRYAFSGVAFSAAKGLPLAWCRAPDVGLPAPDLTLFLDLAPEVAAARGGYGEERYEKEALQARVRTIFKDFGSETRGWVTIDARQDREAVAHEILKHVEPLVQGIDAPIGKLWVDNA